MSADSRRPNPCATRPHRGFTLIELVVVLTLIGLLVALASPRYFHIVDRGKASVQHQNVSVVRDAIDKFFGDLGRYPDTLEELVARRYLREVPVDPVSGERNWTIVGPSDPTLGTVYDIQPAVQATDPSAPSASAVP